MASANCDARFTKHDEGHGSPEATAPRGQALFKEVESTEDARRRRQLLDRISEALKKHTAIEEEIFYPAVRADRDE